MTTLVGEGGVGGSGAAGGGRGTGEGVGGDEEKKRQKRGGKGVIKTKKKVEKERHIQLSRQVISIFLRCLVHACLHTHITLHNYVYEYPILL